MVFVKFLYYKLIVFLHLSIFCKIKSLSVANLQGMGSSGTLLVGNIYVDYLDSSVTEICLCSLIYLFIYLFNHLFITVWTHGHLFYSLGYNPILHYFVIWLKLFSFGHWDLSAWFLCPFDMLHLFVFWVLPYFLALHVALTCLVYSRTQP